MEISKYNFEKTLCWMVYGGLISLAAGLVTSTTILSLYHILFFLPAIYFFKELKIKEMKFSFWALVAMSTAIVLSVIFNQDIAVHGYKPALKVKYFLYGLISIAPLIWFSKNHLTEKRLKILIYLLCISTTVATIAGIIGMNTGYNFISMRAVNLDRNAGLSGMVLNYAHNLAFFQIIVLGLILFRKELKFSLNQKFLIVIFILNFLGLYLSFTRGAMLALVAGIPFCFFKKNKTKFFIFSVLLLLVGSGLYFVSGKKLLRPKSDSERISQWRAAVKAFEERPLLGYGYLNFEQYSVPIKKRYNLGEYQFGGHAHNNFLEMLASTGAIGFIAFIAWLISWFVEMYRREDVIARISLPFIIVFIIGGLTQSTISLGVNLFFILAIYSVGQVYDKANS